MLNFRKLYILTSESLYIKLQKVYILTESLYIKLQKVYILTLNFRKFIY